MTAERVRNMRQSGVNFCRRTRGQAVGADKGRKIYATLADVFSSLRRYRAIDKCETAGLGDVVRYRRAAFLSKLAQDCLGGRQEPHVTMTRTWFAQGEPDRRGADA